MSTSDVFLSIEKCFTKMALVLSILMLTGSVTLGFYQVVTRFFISAPSTWSEKFSIYLMIWAVFLASGYGFRHGMMMSVDVIHRFLSEKKINMLDVFLSGCSFFVVLCIAWLGVELTFRVRFQTMAGLDLSMAWAYAALPIGCVFSSISILGRIVELCRNMKAQDGKREAVKI